MDDKKKERDVVTNALKDLSNEKRARIANGEPPPGLIDNEDENDSDPCPVDASGD